MKGRRARCVLTAKALATLSSMRTWALAALSLLACVGTARAQTGSTATAPTATSVRVRFTSEDPTALTVFVRSLDRWERLCLTPCERRIAPGSYAYALSNGHEPVAAQPERLALGGLDAHVRAHFDDGGQDRAIGIGLTVGGAVVFAAGIVTIPTSAIAFAFPLLYLGFSLVAAGPLMLLAGIIVLACAHASAVVDLIPASDDAPPPAG